MVYGESRRADLVVSHDLTAPAARLKEWRRWPQISAVKTGSLFSISGDLLARATPRILQGGQQLCEDLEKERDDDKKTSGENFKSVTANDP